jgi:hypothetical protein
METPPALGRTFGGSDSGTWPDRVRLIARLDPMVSVAEGGRLPLAIRLEALHLFNPVTGSRLQTEAYRAD